MKTKLKSLGLLAGALAAMAVSNGCALTKGHVGMTYVPQTTTARIQGAEKVAVKVEVLDERTTKDRVSAKKNGYGMEMAPILATNDVAEVLRSAIEMELKQRGFATGEGSLGVVAELSKFYCDFKTGFWSGNAVGEVTMNVQVKTADGRIAFSKLIDGEGVKPHIQIASGGNAQAALNAALQDAVAKLFDDPAFVDSLLQSGKPAVLPAAAMN